MKTLPLNRRQVLRRLGQMIGGVWAFIAFRAVHATPDKATAAAPGRSTKDVPPSPQASDQLPKGYVPTAHAWAMAIDIEKCLGCGLCAAACKRENQVSLKPFYFRTWIERYVIKNPRPGLGESRGETLVDSPNGGIDGFPPCSTPEKEIMRAFFVPKLCNHCEASPCVQACPVGATFKTPDGVVLVDAKYCIGCGFCVQACPYGCRFLNPVKRTAEKCTFCYSRITHKLNPACVEVCPTGARIFGDWKSPTASETVQRFVREHKVQVLKPHLGTSPRVLYAGLDKEVR